MDALKRIIRAIFHRVGLANIIATGTLLLTITTFYYQFWKVSYVLNATIIALKPNCNGAALTTDLIFTNSGNRQCAIVKLSLMTRSYSNDETSKNDSNQWSVIEGKEAPFSLNPNEVVSKKLSFGQKLTMPVYKFSASGPFKQLIADYKLVVVVVDSEGRCHEIVSDTLTTYNESTGQSEIASLPQILKLMPSSVKMNLQSYVSPQR